MKWKMNKIISNKILDFFYFWKSEHKISLNRWDFKKECIMQITKKLFSKEAKMI